MSIETEIATIKIAPYEYCTYCHRAFGSTVTWHGRSRFLGEEVDHVLPKAIGGRVTVPCCSLCNRIKGSLIFDSLRDIQDYLLDKLSCDGSVTLEHAHFVRTERAVRAEYVTLSEIQEVTVESDEVTVDGDAAPEVKRNRPEAKAKRSAESKAVLTRPKYRKKMKRRAAAYDLYGDDLSTGKR